LNLSGGTTMSGQKYFYYAIIFTSGFCLMVMELVAVRLVAPYVGLSIYVWTSIIGIFLLGIILGNWIGGRLADKYPTTKACGIFFILAALSAAAALIVLPAWQVASRTSFFIPLSILFFSFITFFPVAFFLSLITPLVIKLSLDDIAKTGRVAGNMYSVNGVGSIVGTLATGFLLIPFLGTKNIVLGIFLILIVIGFFFLSKGYVQARVFSLILVITITAGFLGVWQKDICFVESQYYCIGLDKIELNDLKRVGVGLRLDKLIHSHIYPPEVDPFGDNYTRLFGTFMGYKFNQQDSFNVLMIGGGGYVMARHILVNYPNATVTVLEIDPKVTQINFEKLGLAPSERMITINQDARVAISNFKEEKFDIVFADAFNDLTVPFHLTTKEMILTVKKHMTEDGVYAMNFVDIPAGGRFFASNIATVSSVFAQGYLFPLKKEWYNTLSRETLVIFASDTQIDEQKWMAAAPLNDPLWSKAPETSRVELKSYISFQDESLKNMVKESNPIVLRDDYAPVENMLAKVYRLNY